MPKVRVAGFSVSLDGFSAGIEQSLSDPLGKRGTEIARWLFHTKSFCSMLGRDGDLSIWTMKLLHPEMAELYRQKVTSVAQALEGPETRTEVSGAPRPHRGHHPDS